MGHYILCKILSFQHPDPIYTYIIPVIFFKTFSTKYICSLIRNLNAYANEAKNVNKDSPITDCYACFNSTCCHCPPPLPHLAPKGICHFFFLTWHSTPHPGHAERHNFPLLGLPTGHYTHIYTHKKKIARTAFRSAINTKKQQQASF